MLIICKPGGAAPAGVFIGCIFYTIIAVGNRLKKFTFAPDNISFIVMAQGYIFDSAAVIKPVFISADAKYTLLTPNNDIMRIHIIINTYLIA